MLLTLYPLRPPADSSVIKARIGRFGVKLMMRFTNQADYNVMYSFIRHKDSLFFFAR